MNTKKSKRWDGKLETLTPDYLNDVIQQMVAYGDRVQFNLTGTAARPAYQVINSSEKKMAFDSNNHLLHPVGDAFEGKNATNPITMDQVRELAAGGGKRSAIERVARGGGVKITGRGVSAATKALDLVNTEKYAYFKANRHLLPEDIKDYSEDITALMNKGIPVAEAFDRIVKLHFS